MSTTSESTETQVVGLGEMKFAVGSGHLTCLGLGSCICLYLYDPSVKVAGVAHVMLPEAPSVEQGPPGKFADTALPALLDEMERLGAMRRRVRAWMVGGAQMSGAKGVGGIFTIGEKNTTAVQAGLVSHRLPLEAQDVGGSRGRSVRIDVATGRAEVNLAGEAPRPL